MLITSIASIALNSFWEKRKIVLGYEYFKTYEEFNDFQHFMLRIMHNSISILYSFFSM